MLRNQRRRTDGNQGTLLIRFVPHADAREDNALSVPLVGSAVQVYLIEEPRVACSDDGDRTGEVLLRTTAIRHSRRDAMAARREQTVFGCDAKAATGGVGCGKLRLFLCRAVEVTAKFTPTYRTAE